MGASEMTTMGEFVVVMAAIFSALILADIKAYCREIRDEIRKLPK